MIILLLAMAGSAAATGARITEFTTSKVRLYDGATVVGTWDKKDLPVPVALEDDGDGCGRPRIKVGDKVYQVRNIDVVTKGRKPCGCTALAPAPAPGTVPSGTDVGSGRGFGVSGGLAETAVPCIGGSR